MLLEAADIQALAAALQNLQPVTQAPMNSTAVKLPTLGWGGFKFGN